MGFSGIPSKTDASCFGALGISQETYMGQQQIGCKNRALLQRAPAQSSLSIHIPTDCQHAHPLRAKRLSKTRKRMTSPYMMCQIQSCSRRNDGQAVSQTMNNVWKESNGAIGQKWGYTVLPKAKRGDLYCKYIRNSTSQAIKTKIILMSKSNFLVVPPHLLLSKCISGIQFDVKRTVLSYKQRLVFIYLNFQTLLHIKYCFGGLERNLHLQLIKVYLLNGSIILLNTQDRHVRNEFMRPAINI